MGRREARAFCQRGSKLLVVQGKDREVALPSGEARLGVCLCGRCNKRELKENPGRESGVERRGENRGPFCRCGSLLSSRRYKRKVVRSRYQPKKTRSSAYLCGHCGERGSERIIRGGGGEEDEQSGQEGRDEQSEEGRAEVSSANWISTSVAFVEDITCVMDERRVVEGSRGECFWPRGTRRRH